MKKIINEMAQLLLTALSSAVLPILDEIVNILNILSDAINEESKAITKFSNLIIKSAKNYAKTSLILYYVVMFFVEFIMFYKIAQGNILYIGFNDLFSYTIIVVIFSLILVKLTRKYFKGNDINYLIYAQLLLFVPLIMVYWVASIEQKCIVLKDLNADQWIAIFNTIIIYFSGCLIGLVSMYKTEKSKK